MGGKLVFDFFHIIGDLILLLERVLGRKQPGQHVLQGCLIAVQIHVDLSDSAGGLSPGTPVLLLWRWALGKRSQEKTHKCHENESVLNRDT